MKDSCRHCDQNGSPGNSLQLPDDPALLAELAASLKDMTSHCTQCKRCLRDCPFLQRFGTPLQLAQRFLDGTLAPDTVLSCSLCRLCGAVCPEQLDPSRMFWLMRCANTMRGQLPRWRYRAIIGYELIGLSRPFRLFSLPSGSRTVFFPGCALPGTRPDQFEHLLSLLREFVPGLGVVFSCCAKPSHDLGRMAFFRRTFSRLVDDLRRHGVDTVLTACPSCQQVFSTYAPESLQVKTVYEVLAANWQAGEMAMHQIEAGVHDPCNARFDRTSQDSVRSLLDRLNISIVEMQHRGAKTYCCGEGGSVFCTASDLAGRWAELRQQEIEGRPVVTYCAGCTGFLGRMMPVSHILDLVMDRDQALAGRLPVSRSPYTYLNRLRLIHKLKRARLS